MTQLKRVFRVRMTQLCSPGSLTLGGPPGSWQQYFHLCVSAFTSSFRFGKPDVLIGSDETWHTAGKRCAQMNCGG